MKPPCRLDRPACGAVLASGLSLARGSSALFGAPSRPRRVPAGPWVSAPDPASGTLLPFLCPAWSSSSSSRHASNRSSARTSTGDRTDRTERTERTDRTDTRKTALVAARLDPRHVRLSRSFSTAQARPAPASDHDHDHDETNESRDLNDTCRKRTNDHHDDHDHQLPPHFWKQHGPMQSQEELLALVDPPEDGETVNDHLEFLHDPYMRRYARPSVPEICVMEAGTTAEYPTWKDLESQDPHVQATVHDLNALVWRRLRNPNKTSADAVYRQYLRLPGLRMASLPFTLRHRLLKALGMVEKKDTEAMLRYFAAVADVKDCGFALWRAEWNAAMSFASRYVGETRAPQMDAAMHLWREMERDVGLRANAVTFNILFDVASKAGNFQLAEMLYGEMERRGIAFNRYHSVSLIHFFGLKMDADGVRAAYRETVLAGEMVDVVVLSCVIAGFLRCGEEHAAHRVYTRMMDKYIERLRRERDQSRLPDFKARASEEGTGIAPSGHDLYTWPDAMQGTLVAGAETPNFASHKMMAHVLMMLARVGRKRPRLRAVYQYLVPTQPNLYTFRLLINHHAVRVGDLGRVMRYLNDMHLLRIPLHGTIFLSLFKGFAIHGGRAGTGTDWNEERLRRIWRALLDALDDKVDGLYVSRWMLMWMLRAFHRCSSPEMVFTAYNALVLRWDMSDDDEEFSVSFLHGLLRNQKYHNADTTGDFDPDDVNWHGGSWASTVTGNLGNTSFRV